jgi:hypothetical protein
VPLSPSPAASTVRALRAAVLTVPAVGSAALAHAAVDPCTSVLGVLLSAGVCWSAAVALLGARRPRVALLGWVLGAQAVTHLMLALTCTDPSSSSGGALLHRTLPGALMLAAHAGAAAAAALLLGRADAGLWTARALLRSGARLLRLLARTLVRLPRVRATVPTLPPVPTVGSRVRGSVWRGGTPVLRGPPRPATA